MSIAGQVKDYLDKQPNLLVSLRRNLLNYSSLSRLILKDLNLPKKKFDAVLVACRRHAKGAVDLSGEKKVREILKKADIKIRTGLCMIILHPHTHLSDHITPVHFVKGNSSITIIAEDEDFSELRKIYEHNMLNSNRSLAEVAVVCSKKASETPGLAAHLSNIIASEGVNVLTTLCGYKDGVFIIDQKDLTKVFRLFEDFKPFQVDSQV